MLFHFSYQVSHRKTALIFKQICPFCPKFSLGLVWEVNCNHCNCAGYHWLGKKNMYVLFSDRVLNIFKVLLLERPEVQHSWKAIVETWHLHWRGCSVILMIRGVIKGWLLRGKQGNLEFSFEYAIYSSILLHSSTILQQHKVYNKKCSSWTVLRTYKVDKFEARWNDNIV